MSLIKDEAIVLRRLDYSETSQVLAIFTREHGQQRIIAKGVKRATKSRPSTGIDLLERGQVVLSARPGRESTLATMTEWRQENTYPHLRRDLAACYAAQYAAEVTAQLTEVHDPHTALFDAMAELLEGLAQGDPCQQLAAFLWRLLTEIGLRPELARCMSCGRDVGADRVLYFSSREGGAICRDCEPAVVEKRRLAPEVARGLVDFGGTGLPDALAAYDLLNYHLTEIMGRPARLADALKDVWSRSAKRR